MIGGPKKLTRVPTGIGSTTAFALGPIEQLDVGDKVAMSWQGRYAVVRGADKSNAMRLWRVKSSSPQSPPQPISAVSDGGHPISPDGSLVAIARDAGGVDVVPVAGGAATTFEGAVGEDPIGFSGDGTALFVTRAVEDTIHVDRIELASHARTSWLQITPEQRPVFYTIALDATGEHVTYSTNSDASDLYILER